MSHPHPPSPLRNTDLERSFRELLAADQARELLRQEAAHFVLLCLDTAAGADHHTSH